MKIYLASSWRNPYQPQVLAELRAAGHEVYDFRNPKPGDTGFAWSDIEPDWLEWDAKRFVKALDHPLARDGFQLDWNAMTNAEGCVLLLPCGRSAPLEAGYFVGAGKTLVILILGENEPELMYRMADAICVSVEETLAALQKTPRQNRDSAAR